MSTLALATWVSVGVLVFGSVAVFIWFLFDAGKVLHGPADGESGEGPGREPAGGSRSVADGGPG